ncbi:MAG: hypothetical protein LPJ89_08520 [Hymenobacteraceae bacterium]|nr:hypothetical protein [Hymenobacteraceae bacterium]MDX5396768.1 hypothetical protein [Hymenobacteraceae bacterium]MDX5443808.1 hypothetical protein [Hymenobacteraceae bacterium]MDX5512830.1 hypothetical protein [Hymenobacteraceae bacterium]
MENDPELNGKYLGTITKDFAVVAETLKEASYQIRKREISEYPIFVFSRQTVPIGSTIIEKEEMALEWDVQASYLELFVQQRIVSEENLADFKRAYKDPDEFCCLFVADTDFTNFVFVPYPED